MSKKLYAFDESDVVKIAKVAKGFEIVETRLGHFDDARLNRGFAASLVPLDREAAVERMARALATESKVVWEDELETSRNYWRDDARASFDALLQEDE